MSALPSQLHGGGDPARLAHVWSKLQIRMQLSRALRHCSKPDPTIGPLQLRKWWYRATRLVDGCRLNWLLCPGDHKANKKAWSLPKILTHHCMALKAFPAISSTRYTRASLGLRSSCSEDVSRIDSQDKQNSIHPPESRVAPAQFLLSRKEGSLFKLLIHKVAVGDLFENNA